MKRRSGSTGMLATALASAMVVAVANSARPDGVLRRLMPGLSSAATVIPLAVVSLFASEFPLHVLAGEVAVAAALAPRAVRRRGGLLALAAVVGSWFGLLRARSAARRAGTVLDSALGAALGPNHRTGLPDSVGRDSATRLQDTWFPAFSERRRYLRHENLSYGTAGVRNHLDIWHRADLPAGGRAPVLVQIHGSAWVAGSKRGQGYPLMAHMAERGWVCVAINYSLAPAARWPAHIIDVKRALAWVKGEIGCYGGDSDFVALTGGSAGGHLTALAALTPGEPVFQPGFEHADTSVAAAVPFYGVYDLLGTSGHAPPEQEAFLSRIVIGASPEQAPEIWRQGSPMSWIRPDAPPFFILHGDIDTLTSHRQARVFADNLRQVSQQPVAYAELPGAQHMWETLPSVRTAATVAAVDSFLSVLHQQRLSVGL
ncbi:Membrane-bound esterase LipM [uncultured Mycobacterium sp.]|uniref:Membrane-bound esterase LipM n=1 Tax=uncultured Mycobacterium sp. TaxID=171292 RepID=A0A1Y5PTB7_9MYCO|nr:Membrane-bound esterase LipM [uncultured Mycobacterium sp.]